MLNLNPVAPFVPWHAGESSIGPESLVLEREPGHWGYHASLDLPGGEKMPQSVLDENAVARHLGVRIQ
jgi:hypothetical protein